MPAQHADESASPDHRYLRSASSFLRAKPPAARRRSDAQSAELPAEAVVAAVAAELQAQAEASWATQALARMLSVRHGTPPRGRAAALVETFAVVVLQLIGLVGRAPRCLARRAGAARGGYARRSLSGGRSDVCVAQRHRARLDVA